VPRQRPLVLALDLDETLVRVCCKGVHHNRKLDQVDFEVLVDVGEPPKHMTFECGVALRPGLGRFFQWIQDRRREGLIEGPWIFTTSTPNFTKAILRKIDPGGHIFSMRVLTRQACIPTRMPGFLLKDLASVPCKESVADRRKVLVDNNPVSCILNPDNAVLVRDWLGDNPEDGELARVRHLLDVVVKGKGEGGIGCPSEEDANDYAGRLARLTPGHGKFLERLKALGSGLEADAPEEVPLLRSALKAISAECQEMKRDLLGAAP